MPVSIVEQRQVNVKDLVEVEESPYRFDPRQAILRKLPDPKAQSDTIDNLLFPSHLNQLNDTDLRAISSLCLIFPEILSLYKDIFKKINGSLPKRPEAPYAPGGLDEYNRSVLYALPFVKLVFPDKITVPAPEKMTANASSLSDLSRLRLLYPSDTFVLMNEAETFESGVRELESAVDYSEALESAFSLKILFPEKIRGSGVITSRMLRGLESSLSDNYRITPRIEDLERYFFDCFRLAVVSADEVIVDGNGIRLMNDLSSGPKPNLSRLPERRNF